MGDAGNILLLASAKLQSTLDCVVAQKGSCCQFTLATLKVRMQFETTKSATVRRYLTSISMIEEPRLGLTPVLILGRVTITALTLCPSSTFASSYSHLRQVFFRQHASI